VENSGAYCLYLHLADNNTFYRNTYDNARGLLTIADVAAIEITRNSATITWTTSEFSDSRVDYGTTRAYGLTAFDPDNVTSHSITLSGLSAGALYYFRVSSTDNENNNTLVSFGYQFTTPAIVAPQPPTRVPQPPTMVVAALVLAAVVVIAAWAFLRMRTRRSGFGS
jgi:hypothetical protein